MSKHKKIETNDIKDWYLGRFSAFENHLNGSRKIGVNKTNKGFRTTGLTGGGSGGGAGGGYTAIQTFYDVKYHCNDCQAQWQKSETETG